VTVATVYVSESNGGTPTVTDNISHMNMGSYDMTGLVVATYPITVSTNSFHKAVRYKLSAKNSSNQIDNFQFWQSAGTPLAGETMVWKTQTAYIQPSASALSGSSACPTADPGSSNVVGTLTTDGTYSDYVFVQIQTTGSTPPGNANQKTFTFQYDEQ